MSKNTLQRLLLFVVGGSILLASIFLLPYGRHAVLSIVTIVALGIAASEMISLFRASGLQLKAWPSVLATVATSSAVYLACLSRDIYPTAPRPMRILTLATALALLFLLMPVAFSREKQFPALLVKTGARALVQLYTGLLGSFIVYSIAGLGTNSGLILCYVILVFGNDSIAWLVGKTLGRHKGIIPVSPNKSLEGFLGGLLGSVGLMFAATAIVPDWVPHSTAFEKILAGFLLGISVIIGDLVESGFKRSAGVKDSGAILPGRGGILDSIDSLLFAAPVFVLVSYLLRHAGMLP